MPWKTYGVANSLADASFPDPVLVEKRPNPLVFCFSGQGPQHWHQGRQLFSAYSVFRESIYACDQIHKDYTEHSFLEETGLFVPDSSNTSSLARDVIWPAGVISVAITFFRIAFFDLLTAISVKPDVIVGHSIGETALLYASGALPRSVRIVNHSFLTDLI
jgi:fatty acid synthase, animal type